MTLDDPMTPFQWVTKRSWDHNADPRDVRGPKRHRRLVDIRMTIARELASHPWNLGLDAIGHELGGRDHSTVFWLLRGGKRQGPVRVRCYDKRHICKDSVAA